MINAVLDHADLAGANFTGASLSGANLNDADLGGACLQDASLWQASLRGARLDGADLTGANLSATGRTGWSIRGVTCQRAFWDPLDQQATSYEEGEFERRFAEQPQLVLRRLRTLKVEDLILLSLLLEHLRAQHPAFGLRLRSLRDDDGGTLLAFQQRLAAGSKATPERESQISLLGPGALAGVRSEVALMVDAALAYPVVDPVLNADGTA